MKQVKPARILKSVSHMTREHTPEIMTGIGLAGMILTTVMAVRATPKALKLLSEKKQELGSDSLSTKDTVKTAWKCYIPAVLVGTASAACIVGGSSVNLRRNAALATAYTLSETALSEYQQKVIETIGEKKEEEIHDSIAKDKLAANPLSGIDIYDTGNGKSLCFDPFTGRPFYSDFEFLRQCVNDLNRQMISEYCVSLNDYYNAINLKPIDPKIGDSLGWNTDKGYIELRLSSQLTDDNRPCMVVGFKYGPIYNYNQ